MNAIPNEFRQLSRGAFKKKFHDILLSIMEAEDDYVKCPFSYKKWQILHPRLNVLILDRFLLVVTLIVISFCKTIYFVTLACFSVILIYRHSLFSYFTIIILSVMTAVTFPLRPPRLAFAICGWRLQYDVHEIKYSVCVCVCIIT